MGGYEGVEALPPCNPPSHAYIIALLKINAMVILQIDSEQLSDLIQNAVRKVISENPSQQNQSDQEQLLTVQEAAEFLSLSVPTIYSLISKGELPVMKRSKRCYFSKIELMNYLKLGRKKSNTEISEEADNYLKSKKH